MSEEAGVPEENPRVQAGDPPPPRILSHATTADPGDRNRSARRECIVHCARATQNATFVWEQVRQV